MGGLSGRAGAAFDRGGHHEMSSPSTAGSQSSVPLGTARRIAPSSAASRSGESSSCARWHTATAISSGSSGRSSPSMRPATSRERARRPESCVGSRTSARTPSAASHDASHHGEVSVSSKSGSGSSTPGSGSGGGSKRLAMSTAPSGPMGRHSDVARPMRSSHHGATRTTGVPSAGTIRSFSTSARRMPVDGRRKRSSWAARNFERAVMRWSASSECLREQSRRSATSRLAPRRASGSSSVLRRSSMASMRASSMLRRRSM